MFLNTKKQGDWGLGQAIAYFTSIGWTVCIPLTDSQDYDIVVDNGAQLLRVQIKTTTYKSKYGIYRALLSVQGGNRSYNTIKKFDNTKVDFVFVVTGDNELYLLPSDILGANCVMLGKKYQKYRI